MATTKHILPLLLLSASLTATAQRQKPTPWDTPASQQEKLDRGFIRINTTSTKPYFSWRLLGSDDEHTSFLILIDGEVKSDTLRDRTSFRPSGIINSSKKVELVTLQNGVPVDTVSPMVFNNNLCHRLKLDRPQPTTTDAKLKDSVYVYTPNDCSVGDVDGDGQYELFVKWAPSNSKDNSQSGYTGATIIDCYKIATGEKLWRIDLGTNIRSGAHYTQYMVYDFDRDGKAELICKTAPGSVDGTGNYVSKAATDTRILNASNTRDCRVSGGRINAGYEYLTVFNGETGAAIHTIPYIPNRNATYVLSDAAGTLNWTFGSKSDTGSYGNRGERYLAGVAYLDGPDKNPSAIMCRGMYTRSYLWAVDFDGKELKTHWIHGSISTTQVERTDANGTKRTRTYSKTTDPKKTHAAYTAYGQGAHSLTIADVDGDGCDEIIYGSATVDNDGWMLYSTGFGHGDALHIGDMNPDRPGLEIFMVHEENPYGAHFIDAATGEVLWASTGDDDNGRGLAANIFDTNSNNRGYEFWSAKVASTINARTLMDITADKPSMNFRIFWDADPYDELLDGTSIRKYTQNGEKLSFTNMGVYSTASTMKTFTSIISTLSSCNSTKSTPCLQADLFGDWREEVIWWNTADPSEIIIFSSTEISPYRVPTLMHDHNYRMAIAWQNTGYNQPPHISYYLPDYVEDLKGVADVIEEQPRTKGDVNEDGKVDISDIVAIINQIAGTATYRYADVNEDEKVDISDIVAVINIIAGAEGQQSE